MTFGYVKTFNKFQLSKVEDFINSITNKVAIILTKLQPYNNMTLILGKNIFIQQQWFVLCVFYW